MNFDEIKDFLASITEKDFFDLMRTAKHSEEDRQRLHKLVLLSRLKEEYLAYSPEQHTRIMFHVADILRVADRPLALGEIMEQWGTEHMRPSAEALALMLASRDDLTLDETGRFSFTADAPPASVPERAPRVTPSVRFAVLKRDGYRCRLCGAAPRDDDAVRLEVDHITPRSRGGSDDLDNLWTLCFRCNRGKGTEDL